MAIPVLIIGKSGSGKSASMRNFKKEELDIINVIGKDLPFRNDFVTYNTDNYAKIKQAIGKSKKKIVVIDDVGYTITNEFMKKHSKNNSGNAIYNMYNVIADNFWELIEFCRTYPEKDKIIYFMMHEDKNDQGEIKPKTIGKLIDEKCVLEGYFTIVLRCASEKSRHFFLTQTDGTDVTKTPIGMFKDMEIDNDLKMVDQTIREYYDLEGGEKNDTKA